MLLPSPLGITDLRGKHGIEPVPPEPHRFVTYVDIALEQEILYLPAQTRIADIHHHREADHLGPDVETKVWIAYRR